MQLLKCTKRFDFVQNAFVIQPYHSLKEMYYCEYAFSTYLAIEPSRDWFAIDWFEMSGRRDLVKNFETGGLLQIEQ